VQVKRLGEGLSGKAGIDEIRPGRVSVSGREPSRAPEPETRLHARAPSLCGIASPNVHRSTSNVRGGDLEKRRIPVDPGSEDGPSTKRNRNSQETLRLNAMVRPDANVQKFVRENDAAARNQAMLHTMHATQQVSAWHERQYQKTGGSTVGGRDLEEQQAELAAARDEVHSVRREKMRALVAADNLKYETELNAMGLTVAKERF